MNQKPIIEITVNENAVIHFELWPEIAPIACASVMRLAEKRIFDLFANRIFIVLACLRKATTTTEFICSRS